MRLTLILLFLFLASSIHAQGLKVDGKFIVDKNNREVILRGIGLGGWMLQEPYMLELSGVASAQHDIKNKIAELIGKENTEAFYESWLNNFITKRDIDSLAKWGFNCIRLPMHYRLFTLSIDEEPDSTKNTWVQKGFQLTDSLLRWCSQNKVYLILDLHAAPGGQGNDLPIADRDPSKPSLWESKANQLKTIALWKKLAERYGSSPWIGGYDLINETNWGFQNPNDKNGCAETENVPLKQLLKTITDTIRTVDKNHIIFIEANCWANNYKGVLPSWDNNLVVSFHKYWNVNDEQSIQGFINIRNNNSLPVWVGESGENSNVWYTDAIRLMEENKIGWAWWPWKKMGINNPLQVIPPRNYDSVLNYWQSKGPRPLKETAIKVFRELGHQVRFEQNKIHYDVIDAMFRQVNTSLTKPFVPHHLIHRLIIYGTDYDLGRNGFAYYDLDSADYHVSTGKGGVGNKGRKYRNDGVDIDTCNDHPGNGYKVFSIEKGEWLQFTLNAERTGDFLIAFRILSKENSTIRMRVNDNSQEQKASIPASGSKWVTYQSGKIHLKKGSNSIRIFFDNAGLELNYIELRDK